MKVCPGCDSSKSLNEFSADRKRSDGLQVRCKDCNRAYRIANKARIAKAMRDYRASNDVLSKQREWYRANRSRKLKTNRERKRELRATDPHFRMLQAVANRLRQFFKGATKSRRSMEMVGCSKEQLISHLESQFEPGMNWNNYGYFGWHIDHIIPLSSAKTQEEAENLCNFKNLRPMWGIDNIRKGNRCSTANLYEVSTEKE